MKVAIIVIAICEVIRALQNALQIGLMIRSNSKKDFSRATDEFIKSLHKTDKEFLESILKEDDLK